MLSFFQLFSWAARTGGFQKAGTTIGSNGLQSSASPSLLHAVAECVPVLSFSRHKGQAGTIGIVGGCDEYTGAPYYAAMSALKTGCDLATVYCTQSAASAIKSYSPELMVAPYLTRDDCISSINAVLLRLHCVVVGPGLGRDTHVQQKAEQIIQAVRDNGKSIIIDADGLRLITAKPQLIKQYNKAILTPNAAEFIKLYQAVLKTDPIQSEPIINVKQLARELQVTIVLKGQQDVISDGINVLICSTEGSPRRNGGQGDMLTGIMAVFTHWMHDTVRHNHSVPSELRLYGPNILAAYAACTLIRECSKQAFSKHGRSMVTTDMLTFLGAAFSKLYER